MYIAKFNKNLKSFKKFKKKLYWIIQLIILESFDTIE